MATYHDHFVLQFGIRTRNFGHCIEPVLVIAGKFGLYIHFNVHWHIGLYKAVDATVMFDGHHNDWQLFSMFLLVSEPSHPRTAVIENGAPRAAPIPTIAARHHNSHGMLVGKELAGLLPELQPF